MRKLLFTMLLAAMAVAHVCAENIAVVAEDGTTKIYRTLDEAINSATDGCVIYLPGGGIPISDSTKVTKRVTIIGVTHRVDTDNADGDTRIGGSINFVGGSDGSALMGVYANGDVNIATENDSVQNILIRYCNVNTINVKRAHCDGIVVNQCFLRGKDNFFGNNNVTITNCVVGGVHYVDAGTIDHNIIIGGGTLTNSTVYNDINNTEITNNIHLCGSYNYFRNSQSNQVYNNVYNWSSDLGGQGFNALRYNSGTKIFVNDSYGISPMSDFHVVDSIGIGAATDGTDIGIYGGTGFKDDCVAPIPRIVTKNIPEKTDAEGKLNIRIEAKFD